jgi:acetyltransferase-like isoleucine patch superfamily enzyme
VSGKITFNGTCNIGHGSKISVGKTGDLYFGDNFTITAESTIVCFKEISFGNNCLLSWEILIMDTDFHKIKSDKGELLNSESSIIIGENVWIGCRTTILKGTKISNGCVVGANSLINKDLLKTNSIYAGIPAKVIKENITWEL